MRLNELYDDSLNEGFWDEFKAGFRAGKEDYVRRQAAKMGMTVSQAVQQAQAEPPGSNAPPKTKATTTLANFKPSTKAPTPSKPTGIPPTLSGGAPGVGNPKIDPATGWPVGAQSWAAGALPPRPGVAPPKQSKPRISVRAATGPAQQTQVSPTLSGGLKGPGNPQVDPATGWPKGAEAWSAGPLPSRSQTSVPTAPSVAKTSDYNTIIKTLDGLSKKEQQKILTQLLSRLGTPIS